MMHEHRIAELIVKHLTGELTVDEKMELDVWRDASPGNQAFLEERMQPDLVLQRCRQFEKIDEAAIRRKFRRRISREDADMKGKPQVIIGFRKGIAVCVVLIAVMVVMVFTLKYRYKEHVDPVKEQLIDVKAIFIGGAVEKDGWMIKRTGKQELEYSRSYGHGNFRDVVRHKIVNGYGELCRLKLPDGTEVVLGPGSALSYQVSGPGDESLRGSIFLIGQAMFNVGHSLNHPFSVKTTHGRVEMLSASCTIRDYAKGEAFRAACVWGRILVSNVREEFMLGPKEEISVTERSEKTWIKHADIGECIFSKEPYFELTDRKLGQFMEDVRCWYGMDTIIYRGGADWRTRSRISGSIRNDVPLPKLLRYLELPDMRFSVEGKSIVVQCRS